MKVVKNEAANGYVNVKVDASPAEVTHAFATALESFAAQMGLQVDPSKPVLDQVKNGLKIADPESIVSQQAIANLVPFAVDKSGVVPAFDPKPRIAAPIQNGKAFSFDFNMLPKPVYELDSYDPVELTVPPFAVPDEQVDYQMRLLAESFTSFEADEPHPVGSTDAFLLKLDALIDGKRNDQLSCESRAYQMGMDMMPPAFDENLLGMEVGEERHFVIEMPDGMGQYSKKPLDCTVTILQMQKAVIPEIDDAFVAANLPFYKDAEALREAMRERMAKDLRRNYDDMLQNLATNEIANRFSGKIEDAVYEATRETMVNNMRGAMAQQGINFNDFVEQQGGPDQFGMSMMIQARQALVEGYALDAVYRHAKLNLSDEDIDQACRTLNPQDPEGMRRNMERTGYGYALRETAERLKAQRYLVEQASITIDESLPLM